MTRVMIAVDDSDDSMQAARSAAALFGDDAEYLVVNVAPTFMPAGAAPWGMVMPCQPDLGVGYSMSPSTTTVIETKAGEARAVSQAEQTATEVAHDADVKHAEAVGVTGDPAAAIITAAREHHADVIVVGSHDSSWFHRLFLGSVRADVVRQADIPVLVVK